MTDDERTEPLPQDALQIPPLVRFLGQLLEGITHELLIETSANATADIDEESVEDGSANDDADAAVDANRNLEEIPARRSKLDLVDVDAWVAWTLLGLELFSTEQLPTVEEVATKSRYIILKAASVRFNGVITHMANALKMSRRRLRDCLKQGGLYQDR